MIPILRSVWDETAAASKIPSVAHDMLPLPAGQSPAAVCRNDRALLRRYLPGNRKIGC